MVLSNHQQLEHLFNSLFRLKTMETSKLCINSLVTSPSHYKNMEKNFTPWHHHGCGLRWLPCNRKPCCKQPPSWVHGLHNGTAHTVENTSMVAGAGFDLITCSRTKYTRSLRSGSHFKFSTQRYHLIFITGIPILVKWHPYIEMAPMTRFNTYCLSRISILITWDCLIFIFIMGICLFHKSHDAPVPYLTMHHSEQKCAHFCSEWCSVGYGTDELWDLRIMSIPVLTRQHTYNEMSWLEQSSGACLNHWQLSMAWMSNHIPQHWIYYNHLFRPWIHVLPQTSSWHGC